MFGKRIYYVRELQNSSSFREAVTIFASSLKNAKRTALRKQFLKGTVLTISDENDQPLCVKEGKYWCVL